MPYLDKEEKFYDYRTEEVTDNILFDINKCDYPYFKELLSKSDYMREHKNLVGEITYVKPVDYFKGCAEIFNERSDGSYSGDTELRQTAKDKITINHLKDVILKYKKKFPMGYLDYAGLGQEGRHRMYVAGELSGWDVSQPVFVVRWADEELHKKEAENKRLADTQRRIKNAVKECMWYDYENISDLEHQLQYELNRQYSVGIDDEDIKFELTSSDTDGAFVVSCMGATYEFPYEDIKFVESDEDLLDDVDLELDVPEDIDKWLSDYLGGDLKESLEKHDELNQKIWDGDTLRPDVKTAVLRIVNKYIEDSEVLSPNDVIDIEILGSSANYNYTEHSDLDVHIIVNMESISTDPAIVQIACNAEKSLFNNGYNITIKGIAVELYVEDVRSCAMSNGVYSVLYDRWIKVPEKSYVPDVSQDATFTELLNEWKHRSLQALESTSPLDIQSFVNELYNLRRTSLMSDGEFSYGNLVFKELRNDGSLSELKERIKELQSKELSLEKLN